MPATYFDVYSAAKRRLRVAGVEAYAQEARLLLAFAAGKNTSDFLKDINLYAGSEYEKRALDMADRRAAGEPAAYILGAWEFYGLPFVVNENVLIPRTDTEVLVETAIKALREKGGRVLDLCCGSGCIGIAIAKNLPGARVICADISDEALSVARKNALINGVRQGFYCVRADALGAPELQFGSFDMIVCNPPYIVSREIETLDLSVRGFEPHLALDGGADGLEFYRSVCGGWRKLLAKGGDLIFECGEGQAEKVKSIAAGESLEFVQCLRDTGGIERVLHFTNIQEDE